MGFWEKYLSSVEEKKKKKKVISFPSAESAQFDIQSLYFSATFHVS